MPLSGGSNYGKVHDRVALGFGLNSERSRNHGDIELRLQLITVLENNIWALGYSR